MSLLVVYVRHDKAYIISDTLQFFAGGGSVGHTSKALPVPHLNCALAIRGPIEVLYETYLATLRSGLVNFDDLSENLPEMWSEGLEAYLNVYSEFVDTHKTPGGEDLSRAVEAFAVGFSERAGHFRGFQYTTRNDLKPEEIPMNDMAAAPMLDARRKEAFMATIKKKLKVPTDLVRVMRQQKELVDECSGMAGGSAILISLTRRDIRISKVATL